jgi:CBS domain-containing protein
MITCPSCGYAKVIEGADTCPKCGAPLVHLSKPRATSPMARSIHKESIATLAPRRPVTVSPDMKTGDVLRLLVDKMVGCAVVVDDQQKPVGIFSERDALLRLNTAAAALGDRPISEFMTPGPETLELDDKIAYAIHKMDLGGFRHVPITRDGMVEGVISVRDILRYITNDLLAADE